MFSSGGHWGDCIKRLHCLHLSESEGGLLTHFQSSDRAEILNTFIPKEYEEHDIPFRHLYISTFKLKIPVQSFYVTPAIVPKRFRAVVNHK